MKFQSAVTHLKFLYYLFKNYDKNFSNWRGSDWKFL